jgi:MFS family permease
VFAALRLPDFRLLLIGGLVSNLGSWLLMFALPYRVFELTGSATATGLTVVAEALPSLLVGPVAGVFVDRWDLRRVMIATDLLRAVVLVGLLFADRPGRVGWVYLALLAENVGTVFSQPAARALLPGLVGTGPELAGANSLLAVNSGLVNLAGPPVGALLLVWLGLPALVLIDMASYLVSAVAIARLRLRARRARGGCRRCPPRSVPGCAGCSAAGRCAGCCRSRSSSSRRTPCSPRCWCRSWRSGSAGSRGRWARCCPRWAPVSWSVARWPGRWCAAGRRGCR